MFGCTQNFTYYGVNVPPGLDDCTQLTTCSIIALVHLIVFLFPHYVHLLLRKRNPRNATLFTIAKRLILVVIFLLYSVEIIEIIREFKAGYSPPSISYIFPIIQCLLLGFVLLLDIYEANKNALNSGALFTFWTLCLLYDITRTWSHYHPGIENYGRRLGIGIVLSLREFLCLVMVVATCFSEHKSVEEAPPDGSKPCPENDASFASRITFSWITPLIILGYRKSLTATDLWSLSHQETTARVSRDFLKHLAGYLHLSRARASQKNCRVVEPAVVYEDKNGAQPDVAVVDPLLPGNKGKKCDETKEKKAETEEKVKDTKPFDGSVVKAILRTYYPTFIISILFKISSDLLMFLGPSILKRLVQFVTYPNQPMWIGYVLTAAIFLSATLQTIMLHQYFDSVFRLGMRIRSVLISAVYRKALVLNNASRRESTVGEIVNLMSVDAQKFLDLMPNINMIWSGPLQITVAIILLYNELGPSVFAGLAMMILLLPINAVIANASRKLQMRQMKLKDERIKMMSEILNGIKVLKLYAWEKCFIDVVQCIREKELRVLRHSSYLGAINMFTFSCAPVLVSLVSFGVFVISDKRNILTAEKAFVSLSLFNILRFPLMMFPMIIGAIIQASVSLKRLTNFLHLPEIDAGNVQRLSDSLGVASDVAANVVDGTFSWDTVPDTGSKDGASRSGPGPAGEEGGDMVPSVAGHLQDINVTFARGELTAIVGSVGSGKSSLLSALLGDMERVKGRVTVCGRVAYVPQQAWILNATVKDNILFHCQGPSSSAKTDIQLSASNNHLKTTKYHDSVFYDDEWYKRVVQCCQLEPDLAILPAGDETEIGEKGVNLSGGQKQRISLARACYSRADVFLLDDPLSAVDAHVAKNLMDLVLSGEGLLGQKTRILVTHNITFLPHCDHIIVMEHGRVKLSGSYAELMQNSQFAAFITTHLTEAKDDKAAEAELLEKVDSENSAAAIESLLEAKQIALKEKEQILQDAEKCLQRSGSTEDQETAERLKQCKADLSKSQQSLNSLHEKVDKEKPQQLRQASKESEKKSPVKVRKLIEEEKSKQGEVAIGVYISYVRSVGLFFVALIIALYVLSNLCSLGGNLWLADWTSGGKKSSRGSSLCTPVVDNKTDLPDENATLLEREEDIKRFAGDRDMRLGVYAVLTLSQAVFIYLASLVFANGALKSSRFLHRNLLHRVLRYPMSHLDSLPVGRILNRFSSDIATVDMQLPMQWQMWIATVLSCLLTLVAVALPNAWILLPIALISVLYYVMQRLYVASSRQMKRLESVSRSPIFSHFGESLQGVSSIRAYDQCDTFIHISETRVDDNMRANYPSIISNRWLAVRLESVANVIVMLAALFAVLSRNWCWGLTPGYAGLSITYAMGITQTLNWMVRMTSELETNIVSVERIDEYTMANTEAEWDIEEVKPPAEWPEKGEIVFKNYSLRYRDDLPPVLHDLTFHVAPGEKVGLVGRTGSGKSSLVSGLFRIVEPMLGSKITVDGRDIGTLGLYDVRGRFTIIPQDPVLFSGPLRRNLDPENRKSDETLWEVLSNANLKQFIQDTAGAAGLDMIISEGGQNLSVGQRQLVCLARALLRRSRILVLDEATAAVDLDTDQLIQNTIRQDFKHSTVLTIAHRLHTVMDYDRILVLDKGEIVEFDSPQNLLAKPDGVFASMARDANL